MNKEKIFEGSKKQETCKQAKLSMWLSIIGACLVFTGFLMLLGFLVFAIAFILGIVSLIKIQRSYGLLTGKGFAIAGISIPVIFLLIFVSIFFPISRIQAFKNKQVCAMHLARLGEATRLYANEFNAGYPSPDNWCDLLVKHTSVRWEFFLCPSKTKKSRSCYAMNPDCEPNSPPDIVLLFETKGGWNQFGGPEILTTENHSGKGCNVLFNDGRVEFVTKEQIGRLKWKSVDSEGPWK